MLPTAATNAMESLTSTVSVFIAIALAGAVLGSILARQLGGRSRAKRQAIFSLISLAGLLFAAYIARSL